MADDTGLQALMTDLRDGIKDLGEGVQALMQLKENEDRHEKLPDPDSFWSKLTDKIDELIEAKKVDPAVKDALGIRPPDIDGKDAGPKHPFKSLTDFLYCAKTHEMPEWQGKAWGAGGADGGFLIPEEYRSELFSLPLEDDVARSHGARVIPMTTDTVHFPAVDQSSQAASLFGGVIVYRPALGAAITATNPTFAQITLEVSKLAAATTPPYEIVADSNVALSSLLVSMLGEALRYQQDEDFLIGDGNGKAQGVKEAACAVAYNRAGAGAITSADVLGMYSRHIFRGGRSCWVANQTTMPQLYDLKNTTGNYPLMVLNIATGVPATLLGLPIVFTEKVPALGTKGDLMLCNWPYYLIGDREDTRLEWSSHVQFLNDNLALKGVDRIDGAPWMASTYTPRKGSTLSPFVVLN